MGIMLIGFIMFAEFIVPRRAAIIGAKFIRAAITGAAMFAGTAIIGTIVFVGTGAIGGIAFAGTATIGIVIPIGAIMPTGFT
jgi:hypothetical protein